MEQEDLTKEDGELSDDHDSIEYLVTDELVVSDDQTESEVKNTTASSKSDKQPETCQSSTIASRSSSSHVSKSSHYSSHTRQKPHSSVSSRRRSRSPLANRRPILHGRGSPYSRSYSNRYREQRENSSRNRYTDKKKGSVKNDSSSSRQFVQTNVYNGLPFLDVSVPPPPLQPPPPPPLPGLPPESPPPPPPLVAPPTDTKSRPFNKKLLKPKNTFQRLPQYIPKPPPENIDDTDYVDLLLEYKQIQKQLESISKEEVSLECNPDSADNKNTVSEEDEGGDDEEDLNELELRLAALASYAKANRQAMEQEPEKDNSPSPIHTDHAPVKLHIADEQTNRPGGRRRRGREKRKRKRETFKVGHGEHVSLMDEISTSKLDNYDEVEMDLANSDEETSPVIEGSEKIPGILDDNFAFMTYPHQTTGPFSYASQPPQVDSDQVSFNFETTWKSSGETIPGLDLWQCEPPPSNSQLLSPNGVIPSNNSNQVYNDTSSEPGLAGDPLIDTAPGVKDEDGDEGVDELRAQLLQQVTEVSGNVETLPEVVVEDKEDPAEILKKKLLKDLAKRKHKMNMPKTCYPSCVSPTMSRVSSAGDLLSQLKATQASSTARQSPVPVDMPLPQHEPLVISLAEDSSDDEAGTLPVHASPQQGENFLMGIDSFLRQAKEASQGKNSAPPSIKSTSSDVPVVSEVTPVSSPAADVAEGQMEEAGVEAKSGVPPEQTTVELQKKMKHLEGVVIKQRRSLHGDEDTLSILQRHMKHRSNQLVETEKTVHKLREQLAAANKTYKLNKELLDKLNLTAKELTHRVSLKGRVLRSVEDELSSLGKKVLGDTYNIPRQVSVKKTESLTVTVANNKVKQSVTVTDKSKGSKKPGPQSSYTKSLAVILNKGAKKPTTSSLPSNRQQTQISDESKKVKSAKLSAEKERLLKLQMTLEHKIKQIKEVVTNKNSVKTADSGKTADSRKTADGTIRKTVTNSATSRASKAPAAFPSSANVVAAAGNFEEVVSTLQHQPSPEHISTEETMSFNISSSDVEKEITVPSRRKSLVSADSSTKPAMLMPEGQGIPTGGLPKHEKTVIRWKNTKEAIKDVNPAVKSSHENKAKPRVGKIIPKKFASGNFKMPHGKQLIKLNEQLKNSLRKMLSQDKIPPHGHRHQTMLWYEGHNDIPEGKVVIPPSAESTREQPVTTSGYKPYASSLRLFRSYRISSYFSKNPAIQLRSSTASHLINPKQILCPYDLTGKCLDKKCPWQHKRSYTMNHKDLMLDLAAYSTVGDSTKDCSLLQPKIDSVVDNYVKRNPDLTLNQKLHGIIKNVKHQKNMNFHQSVALEARTWRPMPKLCHSDAESELVKPVENVGRQQWKQLVMAAAAGIDDEDIVSEEDVRYWMLSNSAEDATTDMESAVLSDPTNVHMWLKLANKKLHDHRRSDNCLEHVLSVLSRGLEANRSSSELWIFYLRLYAMHKECSKSELLDMYSKALRYAPNYTLHCKHLELCPTFSQKVEACRVIREYLLSPSHQLTAPVRSHFMLETLLFSVQLCLLMARPKGALSILQNVLMGKGGKAQKIWVCLTNTDRVLAWVCYIHIMEFRCLPIHLHESANSNPARLTNKKAVELVWNGAGTRLPHEELNTQLESALEACLPGVEKSGQPEMLLPLIISLVHLHLEHYKWDEAVTLCETLLDRFPALMDLWLVLAQIHAQNEDPGLIVETLDRAAMNDIYCAKLYLQLARYQVLKEHIAWAKETLEKYAFTIFFEGGDAPNYINPKMLYRVLLGQVDVMPLNLPQPLVDDDTINKQKADIWQCYCELLVIDGDMLEARRMFNEAVSSLINADHLHTMWKSYLRFFYVHFVSSQGSLPGNHVSSYLELVMRCLKTSPSRFAVEVVPSCLYLDFTHHNDTIDLYLHCIQRQSRTDAYQELVNLMPANIHLIQKACQHWLQEGETQRVMGYCIGALLDHPKALPLHKLVLLTADMMGASNSEMRTHFDRATEKIPFSLILWKNYLLFELSRGTPDRVRSVLQRAQQYDIPLHNTLSSALNEHTTSPGSAPAPALATPHQS